MRFKWAYTGLLVLLIVAGATGFYLQSQTISKLKSELNSARLQINTQSSIQPPAQAQIDALTSALSKAQSDITSQGQQIASGLSSINDRLSSLLNQPALSSNQGSISNQVTNIDIPIAKVLPSVVYIESSKIDATGAPGTVSGSGVIMDPAGYILTNKHVVDGTTDTTVVLQDLRIYKATNIMTDDVLDLAVVKIDAPNLIAATFGDTSNLDLGDTVICLGFPFGFSPAEGGASVTTGIVSNLGRSFFIGNSAYYDVIQTDAAINPGNSGGPMIDTNGLVIGINSSDYTGAQNISFAINIAEAEHVFKDLVKYGYPHHPYLGIGISDFVNVSPGAKIPYEILGASVTDSDPTGPAVAAGLRVEDVITKLNGTGIQTAADLVRAFWRLDVDAKISLTIQRNGNELNISLTAPIRPEGSTFL
jgi:serine protease Do